MWKLTVKANCILDNSSAVNISIFFYNIGSFANREEQYYTALKTLKSAKM